MNIILKAALFAQEAHKEQKRNFSGEPYIIHPCRVATRLILLGHNENVVAAGFLHDTVEDCPKITFDLILKEFNVTVYSFLVDLTNPSKGSKLPRAERKAMDREHIKKGRIESKIIKLVDRIDNLRDMPETESFKKKYREESGLLLEILRGVDENLEKELESLL